MVDNFTAGFLRNLTNIDENTNLETETLNILNTINTNFQQQGLDVFTTQTDSVVYYITQSIAGYMLNNYVYRLPELTASIYENLTVEQDVNIIATTRGSIRNQLNTLEFITNSAIYNTLIPGEVYIVIDKTEDTLDNTQKQEVAETLLNSLSAGSLEFTTGVDDSYDININEGQNLVTLRWDYATRRFFDVDILYYNKAEEVQIIDVSITLVDAFNQLVLDKYTDVIGKDIYYQDLTSLTNEISGIQYLQYFLQEVDENGTIIGPVLNENDVISSGDKIGVIIETEEKEIIVFNPPVVQEGSY